MLVENLNYFVWVLRGRKIESFPLHWKFLSWLQSWAASKLKVYWKFIESPGAGMKVFVGQTGARKINPGQETFNPGQKLSINFQLTFNPVAVHRGNQNRKLSIQAETFNLSFETIPKIKSITKRIMFCLVQIS